MKKIIIFLFLLNFIFISGCVENIECNKPYIHHGTECCLDQNSNNICDVDEGRQGTTNNAPTANDMTVAKQAYTDAYDNYNKLLWEKGSTSPETKEALKDYGKKYDYYMSLKDKQDKYSYEAEFNHNQLNQDEKDVFDLPKAGGTLFELEDAYGLELIDFDGEYSLFMREEARGPQLDYGTPKPELSWRKLETLYRHNYSGHGLKNLPMTTIDDTGREQAIRHLFGEISQGKIYWERPGGQIYEDDASSPIVFQLEKPLESIGFVFDVNPKYFVITTRPPAQTRDGYMTGCDNIYLYNRTTQNYRILTDNPTFEFATPAKCSVRKETIELHGNITTWDEYLFEKPLSDVNQDIKGIRVFAYVAGTGQPLLMFENNVSRFKHYDVTGDYFVYLNQGETGVDMGDLRMKYIDPNRLEESELLVRYADFKSKDPLDASKSKGAYKKFIIAATGNKVAFAVEYNSNIGRDTKNKAGLFLHDIETGKTELIYEKEMARISTVLAENGRVVFSIADIDEYGTTTKWTRHHYVFEIDI